MRKNNLFILVMLALALMLTVGLVLAGCENDSGSSSSGDNGGNSGGNNTGGNNTDGNNSGGNNSGGNDDKTFTFRVKNDASGYTISRIIVSTTINKTGLKITNGQYSDSITYTLTGGNSGFGDFNVAVYYDSSYPDIYAGISVEADWPTSFDLRLWNDNGTIKLSRIQ